MTQNAAVESENNAEWIGMEGGTCCDKQTRRGSGKNTEAPLSDPFRIFEPKPLFGRRRDHFLPCFQTKAKPQRTPTEGRPGEQSLPFPCFALLQLLLTRGFASSAYISLQAMDSVISIIFTLLGGNVSYIVLI